LSPKSCNAAAWGVDHLAAAYSSSVLRKWRAVVRLVFTSAVDCGGRVDSVRANRRPRPRQAEAEAKAVTWLVSEYAPGSTSGDVVDSLPGLGVEVGWVLSTSTSAAKELRTRMPDLAIVLLSQHVETRHSIDLVTKGRVGYLLKDRVFDVDDFMDALRRVSAGGSALDPEVVATLLGPRRDDDPLALLTPRERDVLALMAEGRNNLGIARRLFLTDRTIETHIANIMTKLGLRETDEEHRRVLAVLTWLGIRQRG
jgi:DNA-binding NarL/FixJ family response regulator